LGIRLLWTDCFQLHTEVAQVFGLLYSTKKLCINFDKKWFGLGIHILGEFLANSSGYPEWNYFHGFFALGRILQRWKYKHLKLEDVLKGFLIGISLSSSLKHLK
jgi:hypothetical protein